MKTFEERYTAWVDGELEGNALVAFEQELARRAAVGEAHADKADAMRLSAFLHEHLQAPALTNEDFFNHQLRERIAGERAAMERTPGNRVSAPRVPLFTWPMMRLAWMGAACLFISGALYYGMIPKDRDGGSAGAAAVARNSQHPVANGSANPQVARNDPAPEGNPAAAGQRPSDKDNDPMKLASLTKEQQARLAEEQDRAADLAAKERQRAMIEPGVDIQAHVPDQASPTTATPLHYKDNDVNVLWVNGLDYLPDASAIDQGATPPAANTAAPTGTATP